jgi:integrase/recombinase XerC
MSEHIPIEAILAIPDRTTLIGKRDYAILSLICNHALKNGEIAQLNIADLQSNDRTLKISTKRKLDLELETAIALQDWQENIDTNPEHPLFFALDRSSYGHRLSGTAIYKIVNKVAKSANLSHKISPERLRHSGLHKHGIPFAEADHPVTDIFETSSLVSIPISEFDLLRDKHTILDDLLADKRSANTKRAYEKDLKYFFLFAYGQIPSEPLIKQFLQLNRFEAIALVLKFKSTAIAQNLKEATVNRRLAAIKALVNFAGKIGHCNWNLNEVQSESVQTYRDTTGINIDGIRDMLNQPKRNTLSGKRDYAILRLLWDNALRRNEVSMTDMADFDPEMRSLLILGKGRGTQKTLISLSNSTITAIQDWILAREEFISNANNESINKTSVDTAESRVETNLPLFIALDRANWGHRLTGTAIYKIVSAIAKAAGINKQMSPHRIRHSAITAALDATDGNVRKVQKLSRHKKLDTLILYDDNRKNMQGEVSNLLSDLV